MAQHKDHRQRPRKLIVAGCLVERYRDEIRKNIPEVDAVVGTGELEAILEAAGTRAGCAPASPFNILSGAAATRPGLESRSGTHKATPERAPEGDLRERKGASAATSGRARPPAAHLSLRRDHAAPAGDAASLRPTSRSPRAATIPAPSASFPTCAASSARGALSRWWPRPSSWSAQGVREITLIGQDTTCYGEDLGLKDGLALLLDAAGRD